MSISNTTTKVKYACNGAAVNFSFAFPVLKSEDLRVVLRTVATGVEAELDETTDYSVYALNNDFSGGGVVTTVATYSAAYELCIYREQAATQETDYTDGGAFPAESHEAALDKLTMLVQELQEKVDRCLLVPISEMASGTNLVIPDKIDRAGKALAFDIDGNPVVS
jgi:hypothetical protein